MEKYNFDISSNQGEYGSSADELNTMSDLLDDTPSFETNRENDFYKDYFQASRAFPMSFEMMLDNLGKSFGVSESWGAALDIFPPSSLETPPESDRSSDTRGRINEDDNAFPNPFTNTLKTPNQCGYFVDAYSTGNDSSYNGISSSLRPLRQWTESKDAYSTGNDSSYNGISSSLRPLRQWTESKDSLFSPDEFKTSYDWNPIITKAFTGDVFSEDDLDPIFIETMTSSSSEDSFGASSSDKENWGPIDYLIRKEENRRKEFNYSVAPKKIKMEDVGRQSSRERVETATRASIATQREQAVASPPTCVSSEKPKTGIKLQGNRFCSVPDGAKSANNSALKAIYDDNIYGINYGGANNSRQNVRQNPSTKKSACKKSTGSQGRKKWSCEKRKVDKVKTNEKERRRRAETADLLMDLRILLPQLRIKSSKLQVLRTAKDEIIQLHAEGLRLEKEQARQKEKNRKLQKKLRKRSRK